MLVNAKENNKLKKVVNVGVGEVAVGDSMPL